MSKVLFAGEAIYSLQTIYKGRNSFSMGRYFEHGGYFIKALEENDVDFDLKPTSYAIERTVEFLFSSRRDFAFSIR